MDTNKNMFLVGAHLRVRPGRYRGLRLQYILLITLSLGLNACKIDLDIFGKGSVQTQSGSFDCTSDGSTQSGDCTQTYNVDEEAEACDYDDPNDPYDTFDPDCTYVGETDIVEETWVATPEEGNGFGGFTGHCDGAGSCTHVIDETHANLEQNVLIEAHFAPEPPPEEVTYTHNYLGQMASMTVNGVTTFYVYDEQGRMLSEINESGVSIKDYIYAETELVAWVEKSGDTGDSETEEQVFYPFTNHLGQVYITVRADVKMGHEQYTDPFGRVQAMYIDKTLGVDNVGPLPLVDGLPGQRLQPSGYSDNGWRTYDSTRPGYLQPDRLDMLGRANDPELWVAEEMGTIQLPQEMQMNHLYVYANQNPVMNTDFYGLIPGMHCGPHGCEPLDDDCGCLAKAFLGWEEASVAGAAAATGDFVSKPRVGIGGGGPSGGKTSAWSSAVSKVNKRFGKGAATRAARNVGRFVGKAVPGVGAGIMLYDAAIYNECMKECKECQNEQK